MPSLRLSKTSDIINDVPIAIEVKRNIFHRLCKENGPLTEGVRDSKLIKNIWTSIRGIRDNARPRCSEASTISIP